MPKPLHAMKETLEESTFFLALKKARGHVLSKVLEKRHPGMLSTMADRPLSAACTFLRPESELKSRAFGWPEQDFTPENSVLGQYGEEPWLSLKAGDAAVDFTLKDLEGKTHRLSDYLQSRPVVLTFGMYTCPAYQLSKSLEQELAQKFNGQVTFLHLYSLEPHPKGSSSPDSGKPWELLYSKYEQACTYSARQALAQKIAPEHEHVQVLLLDDLDLNGRVNPVWSTYGPAPRPAFLLRQDGLIETSQLWFTASHLEAAIERLLGQSTVE